MVKEGGKPERTCHQKTFTRARDEKLSRKDSDGGGKKPALR